jgi:hypothetical protein
MFRIGGNRPTVFDPRHTRRGALGDCHAIYTDGADERICLGGEIANLIVPVDTEVILNRWRGERSTLGSGNIERGRCCYRDVAAARSKR